MISLLRYSSRKLSIVVAILTLFETGLAIGALYLIKLLVEVISKDFVPGSETADPGRILIYLGLTGGSLLAAAVIQAVANYYRAAQGLVVSDYVSREIHTRAIAVDLAFYESPKYYDSLARARQAGTQRPAQVVSTVLLLLKSMLFLIAVLIMIAGIDWRLLPAITVAVAGYLVVRVKFTRTFYDWRVRRVQLERRASYLDWLMTSDIHAKELRLAGLARHLQDAYTDIRTKIRGEQLGLERRRARSEAFAATAGVLVFAGATGFLVVQAFADRLSIGDLVLFVLLFRRAEVTGRELVSHISKLYDDQLFLSQLFGFLDVEPEIRVPAIVKSIPEKIETGLVLKDVSFSYPNHANKTLEGINLELKPGKVVALVGENGSGKTSLIKLISRLYDPSEGQITLDGVDVRDFDPEEYRRLFSIIFQDYSKYAETARENIRFGDVSQLPTSPKIQEAARLASAEDFLLGLPDGYDTPLTRMFDDGQEISIGQWQRLALARAFFPESKFIIMDEPTSALDPMAEFSLFENFKERIGDRGALVISHRLSTIRMADYTYVLEDGKIAEAGTHDELVANGKTYADLFERQGRNYRF